MTAPIPTTERSTQSHRVWAARICLGALLVFGQCATVLGAAQDPGQKSVEDDLNKEPDPARRAQRALSLGETAFSEAHDAYLKGQIKAGDQHLTEMIEYLNGCVEALDAGHKARLYKQAELRVGGLMRRMKTLVDDLSVDDRGWAEYTAHQLDEIHDKLLSGVMKK